VGDSKEFGGSTLIQQNNRSSTEPAAEIRIAAALISDPKGRVLLVRKRCSPFFMQPGGKLEPNETILETLAHELYEELGCELMDCVFLGIFSAPAANEPDHIVHASLFRAEISGEITPGAEIEAVVWVDPSQTLELVLAPLTRDFVLPLAQAGSLR
jgi:8-oxo-dGTP diphosphatase